MATRRTMTAGDWLNAVAILMVGVLLGLALDLLFQLEGVSFWVAAIGFPILFGGVLFFGQMFDGLIDRMFPNGIKPSNTPHKAQRKPLAILFSLPVGIIIGVVGAQFGLSEILLSSGGSPMQSVV